MSLLIRIFLILFFSSQFVKTVGVNAQDFDHSNRPSLVPEGARSYPGTYLVPYITAYDPKTLQPIPRRGEEDTYPHLISEMINRLLTWRNEFGKPWSTWVYEKEHTIESKYEHSIRGLLGYHLMLEKDVIKFIIKRHNLVFDEPKFTYNEKDPVASDVEYGSWVNKLSYDGRNEEIARKCEWGKQNISSQACEINLFIIESFAWYTSPDYEKGSLPLEIEEIMEDALNNNPEDYLTRRNSTSHKEYDPYWKDLLEKLKNKQPLFDFKSEQNFLVPGDVMLFLFENKLGLFEEKAVQ